MKITIGEKGLKNTHQLNFPKTTKCVHCKAKARIGFVGYENNTEKRFICQLHKNDPKGEGFWLHDACAVAVYFCKKCLKPTALYNQA